MIHNFNAGPSLLPQSVLKEASEALLNFNNSGLSIVEIGHRTSLFTGVMEEARSLVRELMKLDEEHEVLFLHGGATTQFMQIPMNLLDSTETVAIADTGVWSFKALKEAAVFGNVEIVCSSRESNYNYIPRDFSIPENGKYFHITTNNTIYGTQWQKMPESPIPLVADMSSDIFSRDLDFNSFAAIYAGVQKNAGIAGATLVILNKNILGKINREIPSIMDYRNHIEQKSMLNTPPVFAVYVSMLILRWLKQNGGIAAMEKQNHEKAALLYEAIDNSKIFNGTAAIDDRSKMNITFVASDRKVEEDFLKFAKESNIYGIKGHRSVGGFRASVYNALPLSSVRYLISKMQEFELKH